MLLSVVSVTFNDEVGLRRTLASLRDLAESGLPIEFLVQDGGSQYDWTLLSADFPFASFSSAPDSGIYDAMNSGLARSRGRYVWFLNGGDEFTGVLDRDCLRDVLVSDNRILLFDYERVSTRGLTRRPARADSYLWHALPTSHQAILYPGEVARANPYDLSYRVAADYAFTARLAASGSSFRILHTSIARFYDGGMSSVNSRQVARDANRVQREILRNSAIRRALSQFRHLLSRTHLRIRSKGRTNASN